MTKLTRLLNALKADSRFISSIVAAVAIFVITIFFTVIASHHLRDQEVTDQGNFLSEIAFQLSPKIDQQISSRYLEIQTIASIASIASIDSLSASDTKTRLPSLRRTVDTLAESFPEFQWIGITDLNGKVLVSTKGLLEGVDVSKRPWFVEGIKAPFLGDVHEAIMLAKLLPHDADEPMRFVDIAVPLKNSKGDVIDVLGAHLSWKWAHNIASQLLKPLQERFPVQMTILKKDGTVLMGEERTVPFEKLKPHIPEKYGAFFLEERPNNESYLMGVSTTAGGNDKNSKDLEWIIQTNQLIIRSMLQKLGHKPELVPNGAEAIAALAKERFDLILMDCHMPEMDGYEATMKIRSGKIQSEIPIVAMTANAMAEEKAHCYSIGMNDFMTKPLNIHTVENIVLKNTLPATREIA